MQWSVLDVNLYGTVFCIYSLKHFQNELNKEITQFDTRTEKGTSMHKWLLNMSLHSPYIGDFLENLCSKKVKHT